MEPPARSLRDRRLGRARAHEGRVEHRRRRPCRARADQLLPVRRPLRARSRARSRTRGRETWGGRFPSAVGVSAHTKVDEHTGELLFFNYGTERAVHALRRGRAPTTSWSTTSTVPLPGPRLPHDMAFTEHYAILNDCPLFWDPEADRQGRLRGALPPRAADALRGHPAARRAAATCAGSRPRRPTCCTGSTPTRTATRSCSTASSSATRRRRRAAPARSYERMFHYLALDAMDARAHRWRFNLATGATKEEDLSDRDHGVRHDQRAATAAGRTATPTT